jgi:hypothetical protein
MHIFYYLFENEGIVLHFSQAVGAGLQIRSIIHRDLAQPAPTHVDKGKASV